MSTTAPLLLFCCAEESSRSPPMRCLQLIGVDDLQVSTSARYVGERWRSRFWSMPAGWSMRHRPGHAAPQEEQAPHRDPVSCWSRQDPGRASSSSSTPCRCRQTPARSSNQELRGGAAAPSDHGAGSDQLGGESGGVGRTSPDACKINLFLHIPATHFEIANRDILDCLLIGRAGFHDESGMQLFLCAFDSILGMVARIL